MFIDKFNEQQSVSDVIGIENYVTLPDAKLRFQNISKNHILFVIENNRSIGPYTICKKETVMKDIILALNAPDDKLFFNDIELNLEYSIEKVEDYLKDKHNDELIKLRLTPLPQPSIVQTKIRVKPEGFELDDYSLLVAPSSIIQAKHLLVIYTSDDDKKFKSNIIDSWKSFTNKIENYVIRKKTFTNDNKSNFYLFITSSSQFYFQNSQKLVIEGFNHPVVRTVKHKHAKIVCNHVSNKISSIEHKDKEPSASIETHPTIDELLGMHRR